MKHVQTPAFGVLEHDASQECVFRPWRRIDQFRELQALDQVRGTLVAVLVREALEHYLVANKEGS